MARNVCAGVYGVLVQFDLDDWPLDERLWLQVAVHIAAAEIWLPDFLASRSLAEMLLTFVTLL